MRDGLTIWRGALWVLIWLGFMLLYTFLDVAVWRKKLPGYEPALNIAAMAVCQACFLYLLTGRTGFRLRLTEGFSGRGLMLAVLCAGLMYLLLDKGLDPLIDRAFPGSLDRYRDSLESLSRSPVCSLIQVCLLAPFIEELLMRGFLLEGLRNTYGAAVALAVSAALFALLHFNAVQTLSALVCGVILGGLYLHTGSLLCCMAAHMGYNMISYFDNIVPLMKR